jgi:hypothetical protein
MRLNSNVKLQSKQKNVGYVVKTKLKWMARDSWTRNDNLPKIEFTKFTDLTKNLGGGDEKAGHR